LFLFALKDKCKPVKQEVNGTVILPPSVFPVLTISGKLGCPNMQKKEDAKIKTTKDSVQVVLILASSFFSMLGHPSFPEMVRAGNTKGGSVTVPLTSYLTPLSMDNYRKNKRIEK
jgi:hypothetical protein